MENNQKVNIPNEAKGMDVRQPDVLLSAFDLADNIVTKRYVSILDKLAIRVPDQKFISSEITKQARILRVKKLVYDNNENNIQKLTNVYLSAAGSNSNVAIIVNSDGSKIDFFIGICEEESADNLYPKTQGLHNVIQGNFPGSLGDYDKDVVEDKMMESLLNRVFSDESNVISSVTAVASSRNQSFEENINSIQGIEKLIDTMQGHKFTAMFIANPIQQAKLDDMIAEYENLYSKLQPFLRSDLTFNTGSSDSVSKTISDTLTSTVGTTKSTALSIGTTESTSHAEGTSTTHTDTVGGGFSKSSGISHSETHGTSRGITIDAATVMGAIKFGANAIGCVFPPALVVGKVAGVVGKVVDKTDGFAGGAVKGSSVSKNISDSVSDGTSSSSGFNANYSHSYARTKSITDSTTFGKSETETTSNADIKQSSDSHGVSDGTSHQDNEGKSLQISYENKTIKQLLEKIDEQLKRLNACRSYGVFAAAAYFIGPDEMTSLMAASTYKSLISGTNTSVETAHINTWKDKESVKLVGEYVKKLHHPVFYANDLHDLNVLTPAAIVSGQELAIQMSLPKKSISGVSVIESTPFGRNVLKLDDKDIVKGLPIGNIYHMGAAENKRVSFSMDSLTMHTFVTGSTGSGKSNTVYKMLEGIIARKKKFLVIEPAKGEYKNVFGGRKDVAVYGTNPKISKLLRINPFSFPQDIHILEHIDKLIEIFNVCWPMYAAMPAVLKEAVERAYEESGWDLDLSENNISNDLFPTFTDVLQELNKVISTSAFSQEVKDNYTGALITRVKSLTNGIYGRVFGNNELGDKALFDSNVIVDLSRVGSVETKAMIMGILVMKMQEYRISQGNMNSALSHVTVLEEAHNLLKRTSTEQSSESSNLLGKSVEMLSNIIAEVRTYGEGFIIVDQSPGLMDMSVIRNTNTKIIMRLPDITDRQLVGKAASLNDQQILELSKLPTGVAAVYQNDWLEPILCKIDEHESQNNIKYISKDDGYIADKELRKKIITCLESNIVKDECDLNIVEIRKELFHSNYSTPLKLEILKMLSKDMNYQITDISSVISRLFDIEKAVRYAKEARNIEQWNEMMKRNLDISLKEMSSAYQNVTLQCIVLELEKKYGLEDFSVNWWKLTDRIRRGMV